LLIVTDAFGEIGPLDDCFVEISIHIRSSSRCVDGTVLSAESAAGVQHWRAASAWATTPASRIRRVRQLSIAAALCPSRFGDTQLIAQQAPAEPVRVMRIRVLIR
jgi:hypothetical protein